MISVLEQVILGLGEFFVLAGIFFPLLAILWVFAKYLTKI
jgi:hypothetical protein